LAQSLPSWARLSSSLHFSFSIRSLLLLLSSLMTASELPAEDVACMRRFLSTSMAGPEASELASHSPPESDCHRLPSSSPLPWPIKPPPPPLVCCPLGCCPLCRCCSLPPPPPKPYPSSCCHSPVSAAVVPPHPLYIGLFVLPPLMKSLMLPIFLIDASSSAMLYPFLDLTFFPPSLLWKIFNLAACCRQAWMMPLLACCQSSYHELGPI
jgi:hypothetical protein